MRLVWNLSNELHEIELGGREVHSLIVDGKELFPNVLDECLI